MVATEKRINTAQLFAVVFVLGMSLKMLMLPVLLLKAVGRDSVIALSVISGAELVCLGAAMAAILLAPHRRFPDLLRDCIGKWAARVVCALLAVFFAVKLLLLVGEVRIFFGENLFGEFSWNLYALPLCALCAVIGMGSARALGRTAQFLFPFIIAATVLLFAFIGNGVEFEEILPIGRFAARDVLATVRRYAMWYGDYSALAVFLGSVKRSGKTAFAGISAGVLASLCVVYFMLGLTASFSNLCYLIRFGQSVTGMSHYALGNIMQGRFDLLIFCVWMLSVFIKAGIFSYAVVFYVRAVVPRCNRAVPALTLGLFLYIVELATPSAAGLHSVMIAYFAVPALIVQFAVPALMLTVTLLHRHRRRKGAKTALSHGDNRAKEGQSSEAQ